MRMNCVARLCWVVVAAGAAVLVAAVARAETEAIELQAPVNPDESERYPNPVIDCSTNSAFKSGAYGKYVRAIGFKGCATCHRSTRPGRGDRPVPRYASFTIQNRTEQKLKYEVKVGEKGTWT